jgi:rhodanese-related sulfurtransferase
MKMFLIRVGVIFLLAAGAGLVRARNLTWIPDVEKIKQERQRKGELHGKLRETAGITLERFQELIAAGAVVIDARPAAAFAEGHLALDSFPPVLNVPPDEVDANFERLSELVGLPLVLYCTSNECDMAEEIYSVLQQWGFTDIWIYFPGYEGIQNAKLPTATGPDTWTGSEEQPPQDESSTGETPSDEPPTEGEGEP